MWVALSLALAGVGIRFGVQLPPVRSAIEAGLDGLKLGRFGRLGVEGLTGDPWTAPRARRLTLSDDKGVWVEARDVSMRWRPLALLGRRFEAGRIEAASLRVLRRPQLGPRRPGIPPVSTRIGTVRTTLVLEPAFAVRRGVYAATASFDIARVGLRSGQVTAISQLHPGDRLDVRFAVGGPRPMRLRVDGLEAQGGAIAGSLGLAADRPFRLSVAADGERGGGRFLALATSGSARPLDASGRWTSAGGSTRGRIDLAGSSHTAPWAERLGPELQFEGTGRPVAGGGYRLVGVLATEALTVRLDGEGDPVARRTGAGGLRVSARAPALARILGLEAAQAGPAGYDGVLRGDGRNWTLDGRLAANALGVGDGYRLASATGPLMLAWRGREMVLKSDLTGAGGAGQGFTATLLGAAPRLNVEGARSSAGQLQLRALTLTGRGLEVTAKGSRGLLGGFALSGEAQARRLEEARVGASGGARATWRADQASAGAPWRLSVEARGENLALGYAELDRLLGASPKLDLAGTWGAGALALSRADLDGAALDARGQGGMTRDGSLALRADWSAQGPFRAGPVEVTGAAQGEGKISGPIGSPRVELTARIEALDIPRLPLRDGRLALVFQRQPDGGAGTASLEALSGYGPARGRTDFAFARGGLDLDALDLDAGGLKARGAVSLRRGAASRADLTLDVGPGAFLDAGRANGSLRIVDGAGGPRANLALTARNARWGGRDFVVRAASLTADGPMSRLPFALSARGVSQRGPWTVDGGGTATSLEPGYRIGFDGKAGIAGRLLETTETATFRFGGEDSAARLRLASSDDARIALDFAQRDGTVEATASAERLSLTLIDPDLDGRAEGTLALRGEGARLEGRLDARLTSARGRGTPAARGLDGSVRATLSDDQLTISARTVDARGLNGEFDLTLPTEASAQPFRVAVARQRPMRGTFQAEGEVGPLWALLMGGERTLSGAVRTNGTLAGSLASPRASGRIEVARGRFDDGATGLSLRDVTLNAVFSEHDLQVLEASGGDGRGGTLSGAGVIGLGQADSSTFRLDLAGFQLIDNEQARATASGRLTASRVAEGQVKLAGSLSIDRADVAAEPPTPSGVVAMDVIEVNRPDDLAPPPVARRGPGWALDVKLSAPRRVFLNGRGLDLELSLDAQVGGATNNPRLTGVARVVRGDYDFAGKRFTFDDRSLVYLSTRPEAIRLQLDAQRDDPTLNVTVRIRGTAARPEVILTSSPSLPEDEILSKVLFERSASQLSPVEAAQLASALSSLAGGGGLDVVGNLRAFAGLDRLAFGGGDQSGLTISGGKYLTDDVYLELTGGGRDGPSAQVEWRIGKTLSILSRLAGQAGNRLAVRWRRDY